MSDNLPEKRTGVDMENIARMAKAASDAGYAKSAGSAGVQLATAASLGLSPMAGLFSIYDVKGKPMLSSKLLLGLLNNTSNLDYEWAELSEERATIVIHRMSKRTGAWEEAGRVTYTLDDAKAAGLLSNPTWKSHPKRMLAYRATSEAVSLYCPEVAMDLPVGEPEYDAVVEKVRAAVPHVDVAINSDEPMPVTSDPLAVDEPVFEGEVVPEVVAVDEPTAADMMKPITAAQRKRLWAIAKKSIPADDVDDTVKRVVKWLTKQESTTDIPVSAYDAVITVIETWPDAEPQLSAAEGGEN